MSTHDNAKVAQTLYEAFNAKDVERALGQAGENVEVVNVPLGLTFQGHEGYRQYLQGWIAAFPDSQVTISRTVADETGAITEFIGRGTHTGPLASPAGPIPPTGRPIEIQFCEALEITEGKITKDRLYFDAGTLMRQLGLV
jgi:steroid delta-isomerase-like uncharacterized protein